MLKTISLALAAACLSLPALAHEYTLGDLQIIHPHIPAPAASAKVAGGYVSFANGGAEADRLVSVKADFAMAELHKSEVGADGMARMIQQDFIEVPANGSAALERGGLHIMFMDLSQPLTEGTNVPVTLVFEKAGEITVDFAVEAADAAGGHAGHTTTP